MEMDINLWSTVKSLLRPKPKNIAPDYEVLNIVEYAGQKCMITEVTKLYVNLIHLGTAETVLDRDYAKQVYLVSKDDIKLISERI